MSNERIRVITEEQYKEYIELKKQVADTSKKVRWKPKDGGYYFSVMFDGNIKNYVWNSDVIDNGCYKLGNCFKTEEEAQKELDRRIAEQELLDLADGSLNDNKWFEIEYEPYANCFGPGCYSEITSSCFRFATKESCQKAIDTLGTERLKLIFRID